MSIETVFNGKVFTITRETVLDENEVPHTIERCSRPDVVSVIGLSDEAVMLIKEFRQGSKKHVYWIPGGKIDANELPEVAAQREFEEETGYAIHDMVLFHNKYPSDTFIGNGYVFLSQKIERLKKQAVRSDEHGSITAEFVSIDDALKMTMTGEMPNEFFGYLLLKLKMSR